MSVLNCVQQVLAEAQAPLHYKEITRRLLKSGLWQSEGQTPAATVNALLAVDIKKHGNASAFRRAGRGVFMLNGDVGQSVLKEQTALYGVVRSEEPSLYLSGPTGPCSFTDAAERILKAGRGEPMHYRTITKHALEHGMLNTTGRTPEATMYAQVLTETKRRKRRGEQPRFMMLGKGIISLALWEAKGLSYQIEQANKKVRKELLAQLKEIQPFEFEELVSRLLAAIGFTEVEVTSRSKDGGIDVRGTLVVGEVVQTRLAVQVKRWKNNVQAPVIQQVRGSLGAHEQGLIITTSDFSSGSRKEAARPDATPVALMNGEELVALLVENEIGVRRTPLQLIEIDE
jgi:restriction system protein